MRSIVIFDHNPVVSRAYCIAHGEPSLNVFPGDGESGFTAAEATAAKLAPKASNWTILFI